MSDLRLKLTACVFGSDESRFSVDVTICGKTWKECLTALTPMLTQLGCVPGDIRSTFRYVTKLRPRSTDRTLVFWVRTQVLAVKSTI